jgi:uncharacterized damage-inducible protein DinB
MQDRQDLLEGLKRTPNLLAAFVKSIPEDSLHRRRGDGFWTVAEHISHLAQVQSMLRDRLHRFVDENHPVFVPYIPGEDEDEPDAPPLMTMADAIQTFTRDRHNQLAILEKADEDTWQKTATHPEYERYSLYILTRHILMHDFWHMYRMEELWLTRDAYLTRGE